jgi:hypothetical protein
MNSGCMLLERTDYAMGCSIPESYGTIFVPHRDPFSIRWPKSSTHNFAGIRKR